MRGLSGVKKAAGYALSMAVLALAALAVIPSMIHASGEAAWGSIALGQSIGAVAAVLVGYGWMLSGPAAIARADTASRWREYRESMKVRLVLVVPVVATAAVLSALLATQRRDLAALASVTAGLIGLTSDWFFVGLGRPFVLFFVETLPRVGGTVAAIAVMWLGADAAVGLLLQAVGFTLGVGIASAWIIKRVGAAAAQRQPTRPLGKLLVLHRGGITSSLGASAYVSSPLVIVSAVAPQVQPLYALADKLQRQISIALVPVTTTIQGWVPRAADPSRRARTAIAFAAGIALVTGLGVLVFAPVLMSWLGGGSLRPTTGVVVLMAVFVMLNFTESVVAKAVLATYHRLDVVARATLVSAVIALPLVAVGAVFAGVEGALAAVCLGLAVRLAWEIVASRSSLRAAAPIARERMVENGETG